MVVPTHERTDNTVAVITLGLDGIDTEHWKKYKCAVCGGTVFSYLDTLTFQLPIDVTHLDDQGRFKNAKAFDEIECTHLLSRVHGRVRCQTHYILLRGNFEVTNG